MTKFKGTPNTEYEKPEGEITIEEFYNLGPVSIIGGHNAGNSNALSKFRLKMFNSLTYEDKLKFISNTVTLREDNFD